MLQPIMHLGYMVKPVAPRIQTCAACYCDEQAIITQCICISNLNIEEGLSKYSLQDKKIVHLYRMRLMNGACVLAVSLGESVNES